MKCELLNYARVATGDGKLKCGEICKETRRCPFIHSRRDIFPISDSEQVPETKILGVALVNQEMVT